MHKYEEASREILNKVDVPIKFQQGKHDDAMIHKLSHILYGYAHLRCEDRLDRFDLGMTSAEWLSLRE